MKADINKNLYVRVAGIFESSGFALLLDNYGVDMSLTAIFRNKIHNHTRLKLD